MGPSFSFQYGCAVGPMQVILENCSASGCRCHFVRHETLISFLKHGITLGVNAFTT